MTIEQAQEIIQSLAEHNPFVRLTPKEQEQADKAWRVLSKTCYTESFNTRGVQHVLFQL